MTPAPAMQHLLAAHRISQRLKGRPYLGIGLPHSPTRQSKRYCA